MAVEKLGGILGTLCNLLSYDDCVEALEKDGVFAQVTELGAILESGLKPYSRGAFELLFLCRQLQQLRLLYALQSAVEPTDLLVGGAR